MRQGVLFRIRYVLVSIALLLSLHGAADALWLDVTGTSYPEPGKISVAVEGEAANSGPARIFVSLEDEFYPEPAQLIVSLEGLSPPKGDDRHGLFALPPNYRDPNPFSMPRLAVQYRADFPLSVTFVADGAVGGERVTAAGAFNMATRIIFMNAWWSPHLSATVADFSVEQLALGRLEAGHSGFRSEWKVKF